jgi:hypothetical protein
LETEAAKDPYVTTYNAEPQSAQKFGLDKPSVAATALTFGLSRAPQ